MVSPFFATAEKGAGFASRSLGEGLGDEYMKNKAERGGAVGVSTCSQRRWLTAQSVISIIFKQ